EAEAVAQPARVLDLGRRLVVGDQVARAARGAGLGGEHYACDVVDVDPRCRVLAVIAQSELALADPLAQAAAGAVDRGEPLDHGGAGQPAHHRAELPRDTGVEELDLRAERAERREPAGAPRADPHGATVGEPRPRQASIDVTTAQDAEGDHAPSVSLSGRARR